MSNDILDLFDSAETSIQPLPSHYCQNLELEEKILYLQGLSLMMNVDGSIAATEERWMKTLILTFGLNLSQFEELKRFSQQPDKEVINSFITTFSNRPEAEVFLLDALDLMNADANIHSRENSLLSSMAEKLNLANSLSTITNLYKELKTSGKHNISVFIKAHDDIIKFKHVLDKFEVSEDFINKTEFKKNIDEMDFIWETVHDWEERPKKRDVDILNSCVNHHQFTVYLNYIHEDLSIDAGVVRHKHLGISIINLEKASIKFNSDKKLYEVHREKNLESVDGISIAGIEHFIKTFGSSMNIKLLTSFKPSQFINGNLRNNFNMPIEENEIIKLITNEVINKYCNINHDEGYYYLKKKCGEKVSKCTGITHDDCRFKFRVMKQGS